MIRKSYNAVTLNCLTQTTEITTDTCPTGILSINATDGSFRFEETLPRRRDIRNAKLYCGKHVSMVRRKDGCYYPLLKAINPKDISGNESKSDLAFKIYSELTSALNIID